jgi:hypothetical protein
MKNNTIDLVKFKRLQRYLGENIRSVVGLLEMLWMATQKNCPAGDIGKFSNEEIAILVDYDGNPDALIEYLVSTRFLDEHPDHRLVVHDWHEHAPNWVKAQLIRTSKGFATGPERPSQRPKNGAERPTDPPEKLSKRPIQVAERPTEGTESRSKSDILIAESDLESAHKSALENGQESALESAPPILSYPSLSYPKEGANSLLETIGCSRHSPSEEFCQAWENWILKQQRKTGRRMDDITQKQQLYMLERYTTLEATEILHFSISRTNCNNLIMDGGHKKARETTARTIEEKLNAIMETKNNG